MGRPINKKYFANTNYELFGGANVGGEGVASATAPAGDLADLETGTFTIPAASISAPDLTNGAKPVLQVVVTGATAYTVSVVSAGSGYLSAPTITFNGSITGGSASGSSTPVATLTTGASARQNSIKCEAQISSGSEVTTGDILKQVGSKRYKVQTSDGTAICKLVQTAALGANEMSITATDANSNAYFIRKLTARTCIVERKVSGSGDFATGAKVKWTFGTAAADSVSIENQ